MDGIAQDLKLALRVFWKHPGFAAIVILTLALGSGANTAIFTLLDQILLRQLPVQAPDQLVMLYQDARNNGSNMGSRMHSFPLYQDIQQKARLPLLVSTYRAVSLPTELRST